jgi:hypothetical protein
MHPLDRVNGVLALAVLALAALLWLDRPATKTLPPLTQLHATDINEIKLYEGARIKWSVLRDKSGWTMTHPDITPANSARIDELLSILSTPSLKAWHSPPETLATYGLAEPTYRLEFDTQAIGFGDTEPTSGLRYVSIEDRIHLVGDGYYHHLLAAERAFQAQDD